MKSIRVPEDRLNLALTALDMNFYFLDGKPDYIFQIKNYFEIVFLKANFSSWQNSQIDKWFDALWADYEKRTEVKK